MRKGKGKDAMTSVKEIPTKLVAELRARTGAGMMDCKSALQECGGDLDKAVDILRKKGAAKAEKRAGREASEGWIGSYVHHDGSVAVLVELRSEEHMSELQSRGHLVCRLLLEKKKAN